jgi:hypothetical protein
MMRFYKAKIVKRPAGTAIEHIMPVFRGNVITNVYDINTDGDFRLFVVDCTEEENRSNVSLDSVSLLSENDAIALAAEYQPARRIRTINMETKKEEEQDIPELDLRAYLS